MIVCPNCQHKEISGALFCSECGAQLVKNPGASTQNISKQPTQNLASPQETAAAFPPPPPSDAAISLYILDAGQILPLVGREEFTLGRATEGQPILPDIDLTPFRAYENGVSRLHASIKINNGQVMVTDLGSVNGTRINNQKVPANKPQILNHGDILMLGRLKAQLMIRR